MDFNNRDSFWHRYKPICLPVLRPRYIQCNAHETLTCIEIINSNFTNWYFILISTLNNILSGWLPLVLIIYFSYMTGLNEVSLYIHVYLMARVNTITPGSWPLVLVYAWKLILSSDSLWHARPSLSMPSYVQRTLFYNTYILLSSWLICSNGISVNRYIGFADISAVFPNIDIGIGWHSTDINIVYRISAIDVDPTWLAFDNIQKDFHFKTLLWAQLKNESAIGASNDFMDMFPNLIKTIFSWFIQKFYHS